ncbi:fibronectin type III domain-containing protein [Cytobacillus sp. IB215665]|uniref:fibronectin type III domain-containing protein n=1 Tax=Cytobacillus sp. IB215665 TaxID=3097357 RepID=UPI002A0E23C9|nr:fibronectin type III domain-containing protein [Cytobacillus sp. IB215665]MDX8367202.1 hypothetical protein [Cytobacillus sp. IB215665]
MAPFNVLNSQSTANKAVRAAMLGSVTVATITAPITPLGLVNSAEASSVVKSMDVTFEESTLQTRTKTITIPNSTSVESIATDTGNIEIVSINGDQVTIRVKNGDWVDREAYTDPQKYSKEVTKTETSSDETFPETISYSEDGYTGDIPKYGSVSSRVVSGEYIPEDSKYVEFEDRKWPEFLNKPWDIHYSDEDGYEGRLEVKDAQWEVNKWGENIYYFATIYGTVTKPAVDTRVYEYSQAYSGTIFKSGTEYRNETYAYDVTVNYTDNANPNGSADIEPGIRSTDIIFEENLEQGRTKTITIPNLKSIEDITVDNGNVEVVSIEGDQVTILVKDGNWVNREEYSNTLEKDVTATDTNSTNSFSSTFNYSDEEGYSGSISKNGSASANVVSGSYTAGDSKVVTTYKTNSDNNFATTTSYNSDGYTGQLSKSGSPIEELISGTIETKSIEVLQKNKLSWVVKKWDSIINRWFTDKRNDYEEPETIEHTTDDGYTGTLYKDRTEGDTYREYEEDNDTLRIYRDYIDTFYIGEVTKDTRVFGYKQTYSGTVTKPAVDTRVYEYVQNYSGIVTKEEVGYKNETYAYNVKLTYTQNLNPDGSVDSNNVTVANRDTFTISGTKSDSDNDVTTVKMKLDGGKEYTLASASTEANFSKLFRLEDFRLIQEDIGLNESIVEGSHIINVWIEDELGAKSGEYSVIFTYDKFHVIVRDPANVGVDDLLDNALENINADYINEYRSGLAQYQMDIGRDLVKDDAQLVIDTVNGVKEAEDNSSYQKIDQALNLVNQLDEAVLKASLIDRLEALVTEPSRFRTGMINDTTAFLEWDAAFEGAMYVVKRGGEVVYEGDELSFIDSELTPNSQHEYTMFAKVQNLTSEEITTSLHTKASLVSNITFTEVTHESFRVSWNANENPEGTEYQVLVKDGEEIIVDSGWITDTTGMAYNLEPSNTYTVDIIARNIEGVETEVITKNVTISEYIIDPIENLRISEETSEKVVIEWDHTQPDIEFIVTKARGNINLPGQVVEGNVFEDTDIDAGKEYTYSITARNKKYGTESETVTISANVPYPEAPNKIENLSYELTEDGSYKFTWDEEEKAQLYYFNIYEGSSRKVFKSLGETEITTDKLELDTTYSVELYSIDKYAQQSEKTIIELTTEGTPQAENITDITAEVEGNQVTLTWDEVNDAYGYYVERHLDGKQITRKYVAGTTYQEEVDEGEYEYFVQTYHKTGGMLEPVSKTVTVGTDELPQDSELLINSEVSDDTVSLSWNQLESAYGYYVERWENGIKKFRKYTSANAFEDTNVDEGEVEYHIIAYTKDGFQEPVLHVVNVEKTPLEPIGELNAISTEDSVELSWNALDDAYGYYVERYDSKGIRNYRKYVSGNAFTDSSVSEGEYEYKLIPYTKRGYLDPIYKVVQVGEPIGDITIDDFNVTVDGKTVTLDWENNEKAYRYYIERYDQQGNRNFRNFVDSSQNQYVDENVAYGSYDYKIIVYSANGEAQPVTKTVTLEPSEIVLDSFNVEVDGNNVNLSWDEVEDVYGYYVRRYKDGQRQINKYVTDNQFTDENLVDGEYEYQLVVYSKISGMNEPIIQNITIVNEDPEPVDGEDGGNEVEDTPPATSIEDVLLTVDENNVQLDWNEVDGAYGYYVQRYKDGNRQLHKYITDTSYVDEGLADGEYEFHVILYGSNGMNDPIIKTVVIGEEIEEVPVEEVPVEVPNEETPVNDEQGEEPPEDTSTEETVEEPTEVDEESPNDNEPVENPSSEDTTEITEPEQPVEEEPVIEEAVLPQTIEYVDSNVSGNIVELEWHELTDVYGYYVERWKDGRRQFRVFVSSNSLTDEVNDGGEYEYKIIAYSKTTRTMLAPFEETVLVGMATEQPVEEIIELQEEPEEDNPEDVDDAGDAEGVDDVIGTEADPLEDDDQLVMIAN